MAIKSDFYDEIFQEEKKWIELINANLLNSVYCNLTLKPFYIERKKILEKEYALLPDESIESNITNINNILEKIEYYNKQYNNFKTVNINSLIPLFLTNQKKKLSQKEGSNLNSISNEINRLQIRKQILENQIGNYDRITEDEPDYVYDDFPEEVIKAK